MAVGDATSGDVLSVDDMLARAKAAAASKSSVGKSKVEQLLAAAGQDGDVDTVDLSPVAKLLKARDTEKAKTATPYTEQDWYLQQKVGQLRTQLGIYSNLPGLDPSGAILKGIEQEIRDLIGKQQAKLKKTTDEATAKQAELAKLEAEKANAPTSADDMLAKVQGTLKAPALSKEVQALLDNAKKGASVNTTA